jgi:hypothetical protein
VAPVHFGGRRLARSPTGQQRPPLLTDPGQVERAGRGSAVGLHHVHGGLQLGPAVRAMRQQEGDCLLGGAVLRCGDRGGVRQKAQERRALAAVEAGKQWQVVVAREGCVGLALSQDRGRIGHQQSLDGRKPGIRCRLLVLADQHGLAQQGDEGVSLCRMPGAIIVQRFPGAIVHPGRQPHKHLGRVVQRLRDLAA